jgi:hypothetical protein
MGNKGDTEAHSAPLVTDGKERSKEEGKAVAEWLSRFM